MGGGRLGYDPAGRPAGRPAAGLSRVCAHRELALAAAIMIATDESLHDMLEWNYAMY